MLSILYLQLITEGQKFVWYHFLFKLLLLSTIFCISMEAIGWIFDGRPGQISRLIAYTANALLIAFSLLPLMIWTLYVEMQIKKTIKPLRRSMIIFMGILTVNIFLSFSSPINRLYFFMDVNNVYHRGPWAAFAIIIHFLLFLYNIFLLWMNWSHLDEKKRIAMLVFLFPPLIGFALQMFFYGLSTSWIGVSLSILIAYIKIQSQTIETDYLTGLYNRRQLDYYLHNKIRTLSKDKTFAGIMVDIDHFKNINDKYGHAVGDRALVAASDTLKELFRSNDFIARYAGDEFVILLDVTNEKLLKNRVDDLQERIFHFNKKSGEPFELHISIGYDIYKADVHKNPESFLKHLDKLMYIHKSSKWLRTECKN